MGSKKLVILFTGIAAAVVLFVGASQGLSSANGGARAGAVAQIHAKHVHFKLTKTPPKLTAALRARLTREMKGRPFPAAHRLPVGKTAEKRPDSVASRSSATGGPRNSQADGSFDIFRNFTLGPTIKSNTSGLTGEPAVANAGNVIFATGNWWAAVSGDNGRTWNYVNPYTTFPSSYGGFCCDQRLVYDVSRNIFIWTLQYSSALGGDGHGHNIFRVAVATPQQALAGSWLYYDFVSAPDTEWDYPDLCLSNDYAYYTTNRGVYNSGSVNDAWVFRLPLSGLPTGSINYTFWDVASFPLSNLSLTCTQGAHETMYFGSHNSTSQIRVFAQPESNTTMYWNGGTNLSATWNNGTHVCPTPDNRDWCEFDDGRMKTAWVQDTRQGHLIGFMWNAAGFGGANNCNGTALSCPYLEAARVSVNDSSLPPSYTYYDRPYLWIGGGHGAAQYPSMGVNARGDLGLTWYYSDSTFDPYFAVGIDDDFHRCCGWEVSYVRPSTQGPNGDRWGDYFTVTPFGPNNLAWQTLGTTLQGCGAAGCKETNYVVFGRERDRASVNTVTLPAQATFSTSSGLTAAQSVGFNVDVSNVTSTDLVLRASGSSTNIPGQIVCRDASFSSVSCASGPVRSATFTPNQALSPGGSYDLIVNPAGAPSAMTDAFGNPLPTSSGSLRASTEEQEDSKAATYAWATISNAGAYGGSYTTDDLVSTATFTFSGTGVSWYTITGPGQGKARVYIDGVLKATVDNSAASTTFKVKRTYSGLLSGTHTIRIVPLSQAGANGTGKNIAVDAFQVGATIYSTPTVRYTWHHVADASAWGGGLSLDDIGGAVSQFGFMGTGITTYFKTGPSMGRANLYVDGVLKTTVDLYSPTTAYHVGYGINGLSAGAHILKLVTRGTSNPASTGKDVPLDGWVVEP
jgi:hypothetical protein